MSDTIPTGQSSDLVSKIRQLKKEKTRAPRKEPEVLQQVLDALIASENHENEDTLILKENPDVTSTKDRPPQHCAENRDAFDEADMSSDNEKHHRPLNETAHENYAALPDALVLRKHTNTDPNHDKGVTDQIPTSRTSTPQTFDKEALRVLVREMVLSELQGDFGHDITRNIQKLIRQEVAQTLKAFKDG